MPATPAKTLITQASSLPLETFVPQAFDASVFGNTYYLDSNATNKGDTDRHGFGTTFPFATLSYAISRMRDNVGDVLFIAPGHAETIGAPLSINKEGIKIIAEGVGDNRATFTFDTDTAAGLTIDADNVHIRGCRFLNDIDAQVAMIDIRNAYCTLLDCEFYEGTAKQPLTYILLSAATSDRCTIEGCKIIGRTAGANSGIKIGAALDGLRIQGCTILGDFADAGVHNPTGNVATNLTILDNLIGNDQTGDHAIELVSACTGIIARNVLYGDTSAAVLDPGSCRCFNNAINLGIDLGSGQFPAETEVGSVFVVQKTLTSSSILMTGVDITGPSSGGELLLEDVVLKTDATGLAGGVDVTVETNNTTGQAVAMQTARAGLVANKTVDFNAATVTKIKTVLETGRKFLMKSTVADCTGTGTVQVTLVLRRLAAGATVAAA